MANFVETFRTAGLGLSQMPGMRQFVMLIGLSASIALGVWVVLWSQEPTYRPLFNHVDHSEMSSILDGLERAHIKYKLNNASNMVMVPAAQIYKARIKLASSGLPKTTGVGFEMLQQDQGLTTSRFMETARYRHALEGELSRTISNLDGVVDARVHLAIPRQSSFLENDEKASASVLINLGSGNGLEKSSIAAISRLVASSIPGLESSNVTVVDQTGRLINQENDGNYFAQSKEQFEYKRQFELNLEHRIEAIVTPLIGAAKVRANVSADMDFTHIERTQENFNQLQPVVRSEVITNEKKGQFAEGDESVGGVPGAMSNQPPSAATVKKAVDEKASNSDKLTSSRNHTTRSYEVGKTISHTLIPSGLLQRLSIAVVIDDKSVADKEGKISRQALSADEVTQITALVKNSVGYNQERGDSISVVNSSFAPAQIVEPLSAVPFYEQAWVWTLGKMLAAGLFVVMLLMMVIRPVLRTLADKAVEQPATAPSGQNNYPMGMPYYPTAQTAGLGGMNPAMAGGHPGAMYMPSGSVPVEQGWSQVKTLADQDPKRIAQVMKGWVNT